MSILFKKRLLIFIRMHKIQRRFFTIGISKKRTRDRVRFRFYIYFVGTKKYIRNRIETTIATTEKSLFGFSVFFTALFIRSIT